MVPTIPECTDRRRILVVDDDEDIVELVSFNLRGAGYDVVTAANGADALLRAAETRPDLVLLDVMLPEMDGFAVCEMLRRSPENARTSVIFVTSWSSEDARVLGLEFGAADYVVKPFSPRELVLRVRAVLNRTLPAEPLQN